MSKFYETEKFKKLNKKWQEKLNKTDFKDIEQEDGNLKLWTTHFFKIHYNEILFNAKETYYRMATQFLHEHRFDNQLEQQIWELHCKGMGYISIDKHLGKVVGKARRIIDKLRLAMKQARRPE